MPSSELTQRQQMQYLPEGHTPQSSFSKPGAGYEPPVLKFTESLRTHSPAQATFWLFDKRFDDAGVSVTYKWKLEEGIYVVSTSDFIIQCIAPALRFAAWMDSVEVLSITVHQEAGEQHEGTGELTVYMSLGRWVKVWYGSKVCVLLLLLLGLAWWMIVSLHFVLHIVESV